MTEKTIYLTSEGYCWLLALKLRFSSFQTRVNFIKVLHLQFTSAAIVFSKGDNSYSCKIQV